MKILCLCLLLTALPALTAPPVKVALLALDRNAQNLTDLALAELSAEEHITFLERSEIAAIRKELQLATAADFVPDPRLMQNAQVFAILHKSDFVAFEARTGARLLDQPAADLAQLCTAIRAAGHKQQSFTAGEMRKLSFLPLLPANLSDRQEELARQVETILLRGLGNRDHTVLLERRHLLLLLEEPGQGSRDLTRDLFAGAVVVRMTALPDPQGGIRLRLQFHSPDGQTLLAEDTAVFRDSPDLDQQCEKYLSKLAIPAWEAADKTGEAHNFIREAWFAVSHSRQNEAIASAASAAALDAAHEKELCRIAASAARALWDQSTRPPAERCLAALKNFTLATRLATKNAIFPRALSDSVRYAIALPAQADFARLLQERQQELRAAVESMLQTRLRTLAELQRLAELPGEKWPERLFALEARAEYLRELCRVAEIQWDYSYWERYVYPVLESYIGETNTLLPELLRYEALAWGEKMKICGQAKYRSRRVPQLRQSLDLHVVDRDLAQFFHFRLADHDLANQAVYRRTMELLCTSRILQFALRGQGGLLRLQLGVNSPAELSARQRQGQLPPPAVWAEFRANILAVFAHCELLGPASTTLHNLEQMLGVDQDLEFRLQVQQLCQQRFAWYNPWLNDLINGHQAWSPLECRQVHQKLQGCLQEAAQDLRLEKPSGTANRAYVEKYLRGLLTQLEKQHPELLAEADRPAPRNPFAQTLRPLAEAGELTQPIIFGFDQGCIYLGEYQEKSCQIVKIDPGAGLSVSKGPSHPHQIPWQGRPIQAAILKDYLAAHNGGYVFLFPKDNSPPEILDFRSYFQRRCHALVAAADRLFLSFDGQDGYPGSVLEYNVNTRETTVLVSTLDRTVEWPLQGLQEPYPIRTLLCDATGKRLITLLPDQPPRPGQITYQLRLQEYAWETRKWRAISGLLPIVSTESFHKILLQDGQLYLLLEKGLGRINPSGDWQPAFLLEDRSRFVERLPNYGPVFAAVRVDYSQCAAAARKFAGREFANLYFTHCSGRWLFAREWLLARDNAALIFITAIPPIATVLDGKYVLCAPQPDCRALLLGVLHDNPEPPPATP